ncbi:hypothetical protein RDWZM_002617 [Blomia tropicalis]|uniref:Protein kinase domain-containing protein n=1 Tax=Blomia tropicalis TaxID=40697 RepID=A0A9Q0MGN1_BLOTA|nr:hypothetical protein RDWZM_002617 [Blomia tropicalis]
MFNNSIHYNTNSTNISVGSNHSPQEFEVKDFNFIPPESVEFFSDILGNGSFGYVKKARWKGRVVAVKFQQNKEFIIEAQQLAKIKHDNIITVFGYTIKEDCNVIVMEYAEGGCLENVLSDPDYQSVKYTLSHAISWCLQCARGVLYLHSMKPKPLLHRDLKPLNLLLNADGLILKICDFGTACDKRTVMSNNKGSSVWMAPEVFKGTEYSEKCLNKRKAFISNVQSSISRNNTLINSNSNNPFTGTNDTRRTSDDNSIRPMNTTISRDTLGHRRSNSSGIVLDNIVNNNSIQPTSTSNVTISLNEPTIDEINEDAIVEKSLRNFNAYIVLEERNYPIQPDITNSESLAIFLEHRDLSVKLFRSSCEIARLESYLKDLQRWETDPNRDVARIYVNFINENVELKRMRAGFINQYQQSNHHHQTATSSSVLRQTNSNTNLEVGGWVLVDMPPMNGPSNVDVSYSTFYS